MFVCYTIQENQVTNISTNKKIEDIENNGYSLTDNRIIIKKGEIIEVSKNYIINNENKPIDKYEYELNEIEISSFLNFLKFKKNEEILLIKNIENDNGSFKLLKKYYPEYTI